MTIQAIVFDIGGVLEITSDLGVTAKWERRLNLPAGELDRQLLDIWEGGSIGTISEQDMLRSISERMGMKPIQVAAFMEDIWKEYLGTLNVELVEYFRSLRPKYQTAILSNSFIGAREKEQERYRFDELCDFFIYSHEVGMSKPNPHSYALTCECLGRQPDEVIFLDDHEPNFEAARQMGMHGVLFKNNAQAIADIQHCIQANEP